MGQPSPLLLRSLKLQQPTLGQPGPGQNLMLLMVIMDGTPQLGTPAHGDGVIGRVSKLSGLVSGMEVGGEGGPHGIRLLRSRSRPRPL